MCRGGTTSGKHNRLLLLVLPTFQGYDFLSAQWMWALGPSIGQKGQHFIEVVSRYSNSERRALPLIPSIHCQCLTSNLAHLSMATGHWRYWTSEGFPITVKNIASWAISAPGNICCYLLSSWRKHRKHPVRPFIESWCRIMVGYSARSRYPISFSKGGIPNFFWAPEASVGLVMREVIGILLSRVIG